MKTKCALLLAIALGPAAWADDATTLTVGLRAWSNTWSTWDVYPPTVVGNATIPGASENFSSQDKAALIPSVSLRHGDWLLSASRFVKTRYSFDGNAGPFSSKREETDFHAGYYVLPTLAVSLGHKSVKQEFTGGTEFKYSGPILGVLGSAPLTRGFSLYGNVGYGRVKGRFPVADASGRSKFNADYWLGEAGLAYSFEGVGAAKAMTLTLGYRSQVLATDGFRIALSPTTNRPTELRDTTEGLALGLSLSF
ncbi:hypothetical protein [Inhella sp.]|uniref:hypothetical protein n=1 Tax=Inhella sp. TaxID=1921806 RepID=UPI0035B35E03